LETPYYRVEEGFIQRRKGFHFFSSQREEEERAKIAPADILSSRSLCCLPRVSRYDEVII
jgi:hypothetical protein